MVQLQTVILEIDWCMFEHDTIKTLKLAEVLIQSLQRSLATQTHELHFCRRKEKPTNRLLSLYVDIC